MIAIMTKADGPFEKGDRVAEEAVEGARQVSKGRLEAWRIHKFCVLEEDPEAHSAEPEAAEPEPPAVLTRTRSRRGRNRSEEK